MNASEISGNSADRGGGIDNAGASTTTLTNSTVSGNAARAGAGIIAYGTLTATNVTISGNAATGVGGGLITGNAASNASVTGGTITANTASSGGGVYSTDAAISVKNTIISGNSASSGADCEGGLSSAGRNRDSTWPAAPRAGTSSAARTPSSARLPITAAHKDPHSVLGQPRHRHRPGLPAAGHRPARRLPAAGRRLRHRRLRARGHRTPLGRFRLQRGTHHRRRPEDRALPDLAHNQPSGRLPAAEPDGGPERRARLQVGRPGLLWRRHDWRCPEDGP